jgi:hypothetical protein
MYTRDLAAKQQNDKCMNNNYYVQNVLVYF